MARPFTAGGRAPARALAEMQGLEKAAGVSGLRPNSQPRVGHGVHKCPQIP